MVRWWAPDLREGNSVEELTSEVQHANCNRRQLSVVKELIEVWAPFVSIAEIFEAVSRPAKSCHSKLLAVKNVVIMAMVREVMFSITRIALTSLPDGKGHAGKVL